MTRPEKILSARGAAAISKPGRHSDGGGLYLYCEGGSRSWVYMFTWDGRQKEMGLGPYPVVSLADARARRDKWRKVLLDGENPIEVRNARKSPPVTKTFGQAADELLASKAPEWRNEKHRAQWAMTLQTYCKSIWDVPVSEVDRDAVLTPLMPLWGRITSTASRLRGRIENVLSYACGYRAGPNPAVWRAHLDQILPKRQKLQRPHHPAMEIRLSGATLAAQDRSTAISPAA